MKVLAILACAALITAIAWFADNHIGPLFFYSRISRLGEKNLPKIVVEKGNTIHCRMSADDFRFPLPPGSRATNSIVSGGFDTVEGSVEARFVTASQFSAGEYERWLSGKLQVGGNVTAEPIPGGLLIKFDYFGDK